MVVLALKFLVKKRLGLSDWQRKMPRTNDILKAEFWPLRRLDNKAFAEELNMTERKVHMYMGE